MSKKDYVAFANQLRWLKACKSHLINVNDSKVKVPVIVFDDIVTELCNIFKIDNTRFDENRFIDYINNN